jgi:prepilin-type N-terminal cleavage/methylation domain-containing protein/prepilin-type processing-associated H-X9-DG protein
MSRTLSRAFTLIELLVVIAILAVLLAVLMPALQRVKEGGREAVCKSNLRNIGLGISAYLLDNDYKPANNGSTNGFFWYDTAGKLRGTRDSDAYWGVAYVRYLPQESVFGCPSYRSVAELIYPGDPKLVYHAAFSLNYYLFHAPGSASTGSIRNAAKIPHQDRFIVAHDHVEPKIEQDSVDMFCNDGPGTMNLTHYRQGGQRAKFYRGIFRHATRSQSEFTTGGRANILWLDTHVSSLNETTGDDVPKQWYRGY